MSKSTASGAVPVVSAGTANVSAGTASSEMISVFFMLCCCKNNRLDIAWIYFFVKALSVILFLLGWRR